MQSHGHVREAEQSDGRRQAQQRSEQDQHEHGHVERRIQRRDGFECGRDAPHCCTLSLLATNRAIEIEPNTPTAAMISSTGRLRVWWLMAISAPRMHMTSVGSTSEATARSRIDGPITMRHSVSSAAAAKTT